MEYIQALLDMEIIPAEWWPMIGRSMFYAFLSLACVNGALALADRVDMADGRRDWPRLARVHSAFVVIFAYAQALLEMLPVQMPFVRGLDRLRSIKRAKGGDF